MADMNKRGPDDCEDGGERGERGEHGERGRRGHRGHRGHDGRDGATGPTGPAGSSSGSTGFTGPTGATGGSGSTGPTGPSGEGSQGIAAYGYAAGTGDPTFIGGQDIDFDFGGLVFPNTGLTPPAPTGTTFTILTTGDYEYEFYFTAFPGSDPNSGLSLGIFVNGVSAGVAHTFRSNHNVGGAAGDELVCRGEGLIHLTAGDNVTLRFLSPTKCQCTGFGAGNVAGANRTLSLKKLSA